MAVFFALEIIRPPVPVSGRVMIEAVELKHLNTTTTTELPEFVGKAVTNLTLTKRLQNAYAGPLFLC